MTIWWFWLQVFWQRMGIPCFSLIIPLSGGAEIKPYFALFGSSAICTNSLFLCFHSALLVPLTTSGVASLVSALSNGGKCGLVWWPLEVSMAHQVSLWDERPRERRLALARNPTPATTTIVMRIIIDCFANNQSLNPKRFLRATAPIPPSPLIQAPKFH